MIDCFESEIKCQRRFEIIQQKALCVSVGVCVCGFVFELQNLRSQCASIRRYARNRNGMECISELKDAEIASLTSDMHLVHKNMNISPHTTSEILANYSIFRVDIPLMWVLMCMNLFAHFKLGCVRRNQYKLIFSIPVVFIKQIKWIGKH